MGSPGTVKITLPSPFWYPAIRRQSRYQMDPRVVVPLKCDLGLGLPSVSAVWPHVGGGLNRGLKFVAPFVALCPFLAALNFPLLVYSISGNKLIVLYVYRLG